MKKIILILLGTILLSVKPQEASAFLRFRPPKPTIPPGPTIILPTWIPRRWNFKPTNTPTPTITLTVTPTITPTPTPTSTPTSTPINTPTPTPTPTLVVKRVFVTSSTFDGNLALI